MHTRKLDVILKIKVCLNFKMGKVDTLYKRKLQYKL